VDDIVLKILMYIDRMQQEGKKIVVTTMADDLGIVRERVYDHFRNARNQGLLHPEKYELTPAGQALASEHDMEEES